MSQPQSRPRWIVGGPSRCGKTHLVLALRRCKGRSVAGFPVEGLFTVYGRRLLLTRRSALSLFEEYLTRPRYTDAVRAESERPIDYLTSPIAVLRSALPADRRRPVPIIGWLLDRFAAEQECDGWAVFDLHPEFQYARFRRLIPGLKLAVMLRDPREAVSAAMFWRGGASDRASRDAQFKHRLILYCLGAQTGRRLARRWPSDVEIFDFNALVSGDRAERARVSRSFGIALDILDEAYRFAPDFQFSSNTGSLLPDGRRAKLLDAVELEEISVLTGKGGSVNRAVDGQRPRWRFVTFARVVLVLGRVAPGVARAATDIAYHPRRFAARRINGVRQLARDVWVSIRRGYPLGGELG